MSALRPPADQARGRIRQARIVVWMAVLALAVAATACSIPTDSKPRVIPREEVAGLNPSTTIEPTTTPDPGAPSIKLYLFRDNTLEAVERRTNTARDINSILTQLLAGTTESERAAGYTTFIPPQTRLLRVQLTTDRTLIIDLSSEMDTIGGSTSKAAYAQLVFTATALPEVSQVQFRTAGTPVSVPTDNGNVPTADRTSYNTPFVIGAPTGGGAPGTTATPPVPQIPTSTLP